MAILQEGLVAAGLYVPLALAFSLVAAPQAAFNVSATSVALISAYGCVALVQSGLGALPALGLTALIAFLTSVCFHLTIVRSLLHRSNPERSVLLASLGLMGLTEAALALCFGSELVTLRTSKTFGSLAQLLNHVSTSWLSACLLVAALAGCTAVFLRWTSLGRMFRATCDNRRAAIFYRLPVGCVDAVSAGAAGTIAWLGVMILLLTQAATPSMVLNITLWSVTGAILGGMRSPLGACAGGMILGFLESIAARALPHQMLDLSVGVVFVAALILRPDGLFVRRGRAA